VTGAGVRGRLVEALQLDLVGPWGSVGDEEERLTEAPSRWYLTGFLAPVGDARARTGAGEEEEEGGGEVDGAAREAGGSDDEEPERHASRERFLPSSLGLSALAGPEARTLRVTAGWGEYKRTPGEGGKGWVWARKQRRAEMSLELAEAQETTRELDLPENGGLRLAWLARPLGPMPEGSGIAAGTRAVSVFLVNHRAAREGVERDEAFAFQAGIEARIASPAGLPWVARPNLRGLETHDWDEQVADLQYRDACEHAVGHNAATLTLENGAAVRTDWIPQAQVEQVAAAAMAGVELRMEALAGMDGTELNAALEPMVGRYRAWIAKQAAAAPQAGQRGATAKQLAGNARRAAERMARGLALLSADAEALEAFQIANRAMGMAARRRLPDET